MLGLKRSVVFMLAAMLIPASGIAQDDRSDASTTHQGLTGLFNVISPDTLGAGQVSFGVNHRNYDRELTDIDANDLSATFAIGVSERIELAVAYVTSRQIDFDDAYAPTFYNGFPVAVTTIDDGGGDLTLGLKAALARIEDAGAGISLYAKVKLPTSVEEEGRGTGGTDLTLGTAVGFGGRQVTVFGNAAYTMVGDTSSRLGSLDLADVFNWGAAIEVGSNSIIRGIVELTGESFVSAPSGFPAQKNAVDLAVGFKIGGQHHGGLAFGAAFVRNLSENERERPNGWVAELSLTTPSARPVPMEVVAEAPPPINNPPIASVSANPKEVYPSYSAKANRSTVTAVASDPDGDPLTYTWTASNGRVSGAGPTVTWFPPEGAEQGSYTVTARVSDGKGGEATASDTIMVRPDPEFFEGRVLFGFDKYDLDDAAKAVITGATQHMKKYPELKLNLEGHTCYIATEEYNLVLGQQRADAIRGYLTELGVGADRIGTISYGEARPWQDNSREVTRRLNRRGEFRFRFGN